MNKILILLLIAYLAIYLSDGRKGEVNELPAKESGFPSETLTIFESYRKNSLPSSYYPEDAFAASNKLNLPAHLLVN